MNICAFRLYRHENRHQNLLIFQLRLLYSLNLFTLELASSFLSVADLSSVKDHAVTQTVRRRSGTAEARDRFQVNLCGIYGRL